MPKVSKATTVAKEVKPTKATAKVKDSFSVPMVNLTGKEDGSLSLPKELFGQEVNEKLLAQAIRVYLTNQSTHHSNTKTRSEVQGSTRKIYKQKHTGGARHGSIRAPIFVKGGIALGPKYRKVILDLPKQMKKAALISALSQKMSEKEVLGFDASKVTGKTSQMVPLLSGLNKRSTLFVSNTEEKKLSQAVRNLPKTHFANADTVNVYQLLHYQTLVLTPAGVEQLKKRIAKTEEAQ